MNNKHPISILSVCSLILLAFCATPSYAEAGEPPKAIIHASSTYAQNADSGQVSINFNALDSYDPEAKQLTYHWNFGDGTTSDLPVTRHQFKTYGRQRNFVVTLSVTDDEFLTSSTTESIFVDIFATPVAVIKLANAPTATAPIVNTIYGQSPLTVYFDGSDSYVNNERLGEITSSVWKKDGVEITRNASGSTVFTTGSHTLNLQISNNYDRNSSINSTNVIVYDAAPTAPIPVIRVDRIYGMNPLTVNFDASMSYANGTGVKYLWNFGDGSTSNLINTTHTFSNTDARKEFTVTLTITDSANNQKSSVIKITMFNNSFPIAHPPEIKLSANAISGYAPLTIQLDAAATNRNLATKATITNFKWDFQDGTSIINSPNSSIVHTFSKPGTYKVLLVATDNNAMNGNSAITITVAAPDSGKAVIYTPYLLRVAPFTCLFDGHNSLPSIANKVVKWNWDFGDSSSTDPTNDQGVLVAHKFDKPGTYKINLTTVDTAGKNSTETAIIYISEFYGSTYYVSSSTGNDSYDGSEQFPFASIDKALSKGTSVEKPLKILLKSGDSWVMNTTAVIPAPCFIESYGIGEKPKITRTATGTLFNTTGSSDPIYMFRLANIHISSEIPDIDPNSVPAGLRIKGVAAEIKAPGSTIRNCVIENAGFRAQLQGNGLTLENTTIDVDRHAYSGGIPGLAFDGNDVTVRNSYVGGAGNNDGLDHQIYGSKGKNWLFEGTILDGKNNDGGVNNFALKINSGNNVVVRSCEIKNTRNGVSPGANYPSTYGLSENVLIEKCLIHDNGFHNQAAGIYIDGIKDLIIRNNIFYANHLAPTSGKGVITFDSQAQSQMPDIGNIDIYNNVFYNNEIRDIYLDNAHYGLSVKNNIFIRDNAREFYLVNDITKITSNNNLFNKIYAGADSKFFYVGSNHYTLAAWKALGLDVTSIYADPLFISTIDNSYNFGLQPASPAINKGLPLPGIFEDYAGASRPKGTANDIGAMEFDENLINRQPVANSQNISTAENTPINITLSGYDLDNNPLTFIVTSLPAKGFISGTDANFTYTPAANYTGSDSFTFKVNDGAVDSNTATVSIAVKATIPNAPKNLQASAGLSQINLSWTDWSSNEDGFKIERAASISGPFSQIASIPSPHTATVTYSDTNLSSGTYYYRARSYNAAGNSSYTDVAQATLIPANNAPVASAQSIITNEDASKAITLSAADADGDVLTYSIVTNPTHGTLIGSGVNWTYTPATNYSGNDSFTFKANDGAADSNAATVSITVAATIPGTPINLVASVGLNQINLSWTDWSDNETGFKVERAISSSEPFSQIASMPSPHTATVTYTDTGIPSGTYYYRVRSYNAAGNSGYSNTASTTLKQAINHPPIAYAQSVTTAESKAKNIILGATDSDGDALTYNIVTSPAHGTLSGSGANWTYTPAVNYSGSDFFTFKANDGKADSNIATVNITITIPRRR